MWAAIGWLGEPEEKLGAKFEQRRCYDVILAIRSVPLPVLEQRMARFIAEEASSDVRR